MQLTNFGLHLFVLVVLTTCGMVSARQVVKRQVYLNVRQTNEETRIRGTCTQMSNKCHLPSRDDQICPADYNRARGPPPPPFSRFVNSRGRELTSSTAVSVRQRPLRAHRTQGRLESQSRGAMRVSGRTGSLTEEEKKTEAR
ncbi:hypothetical protein Cob_v002859 [Colletotrichum orbiculare MAFF 240422]|uniref:Secreted protein n=1 Tax=Colletotrichum orbiculare (strain 104-T / ATCC 96160 / CBS 514.97 / LARS 414 / MAFF 240422) TaxID=1213857 RepID=A0A484G2S2_COLOR|nr:hypothetical protein Cob_v002859 [Colletotrichum orbiculare MAFF 240422]